MKLKKTKNKEEKTINTNVCIYYPDRHFYVARLLIEKIYFRLFKNKSTRYLIVTQKNVYPLLGYQQIIKISHQDSIAGLDQKIKQCIYRQNDYLYHPPRSNRFFLRAVVLLCLVGLALTALGYKCFPTPEKYFFATTKHCQLIKNKFTFNVLLRSSMVDWSIYLQEITLRKKLINTLAQENPKNDPYYLDWLYANGIVENQHYKDYLENLKENSVAIKILDHQNNITDIKYSFDLKPERIDGYVYVEKSNTKNPILDFRLPNGFIIHKVVDREGQEVGRQNYWINHSQITLDASSNHASPQGYKVYFSYLPELHVAKSLKLAFELPPGVRLEKHSLEIIYPIERQIVSLRRPQVAQPGLLKYNLPLQGLSLIELVYHPYD